MKLLKPVDLDLSKIFEDDKIYSYLINSQGKLKFSIKTGVVVKKLIPQIHYFINQIIVAEKGTDYNVREFTRIRIADISEVVPYKKLKQIIHLLVRANVITVRGVTEYVNVNGNTFPVNAKYFKLNGFSNETEVIEIPIKRKQKITVNANAKKLIESDSTYLHMYKMVSNYDFDIESAERLINEMYYQKSLSNNQFINYHQYIHRIRNKDVVFSISEKNGRVTTMINLCPRILRRFFMNGKELDFSCFNVHTMIHMVEGIADVSNDALASEMTRIKSNTADDFYQYIVEFFKSYQVNINRAEAKQIVLHHWINAPLSCKREEYKIMNVIYPNISKVMNELKGSNYFEYKEYSNRYMKIESDLIYSIYKRFINLYPNAILYTIYDCVYVEERYVEEIKNIMIIESQNYFKQTLKVN
jgi:hypothetical protein